MVIFPTPKPQELGGSKAPPRRHTALLPHPPGEQHHIHATAGSPVACDCPSTENGVGVVGREGEGGVGNVLPSVFTMLAAS